MFWKKFVDLCVRDGKSPTPVCKEIGFSSALVVKWKRGAIPRDTTLKKVADYFEVPISYFSEDNQKTSLKLQPNAVVLQDMKVHLVPLFESVSAGFGSLADNSIVDYVPCFFVSESEAEETLCLKVKGDSMYPKIEEGDIIQVHKQTEVESGKIAVLLIDSDKGEDEGLVKRIIYGNNCIELQSINPLYPPMKFDGAEMNRIRVLGEVRKIIKSV